MAEVQSTCIVPSCSREPDGIGYCSGHYQRLRKTGDVRADVPLRSRGTLSGRCTAEGCDADIQQRTMGLCDAHYKRVWRDPSADLSTPVAPARKAPVPVLDFPDGTRECQECRERLPLSGFHRDRKGPGGYRKTCKSCRIARETERYWASPEAVAKRVRVHRLENLESIRARESAYYEANREARIEKSLEHTHRRRASLYGERRDRGISRLALKRLDGETCCYCSVRMIFASFPRGERPDNQATIEHVVALSRGGTHTWDNCALACWRCNIAKGARDGDWRIVAGHRISARQVEVGA